MRKIACLLLVLALTSSLIILVSDVVSYSRAYPYRTWIVDSHGNGADFTTIGAAINAADNGDTIYVKPGIYQSGTMRIQKSLTLVGENPETTIIDVGRATPGVEIVTDYVTFKGFWITGYPQYVFWIQSNYANHINIEGNIIQPYTNYSYPYYTPIAIGLVTDGGYNRICWNDMSNVADGILAVGSSRFDVFAGNKIFASDTGITVSSHNGYVTNCTIANNTIFGGDAFGILLTAGHSNVIDGNVIGGNFSESFGLGNTYNNVVSRNVFETSGRYSLVLSNSTNDLFYGNSFLNSSYTFTMPLVSDTWDNGYPSGGNYWRYYTGVDQHTGPNQNLAGSDGIGDTPYIWGDINDRFPLMQPPVDFIYQASPSWQRTQIVTPDPPPSYTPTPTPSPTPTPTQTPVPTPVPTPTPPTPLTAESTATAAPTPTSTPIPTPIQTPVPPETEIPPSPQSGNTQQNSAYLLVAVGALSVVLVVIVVVRIRFRKP